jgi:DNA-binding transcriptional ArsR family regulator
MLDMTIPVREVPTTALDSHRRRMQGRFLKGPIPLSDIAEASKLPGQTLGVYLAIHHRAALTGSMTVTLPKGLLDQLGISRDSKSRSLRLLEEAALIAVERRKGRTARITLPASAQHTSTGR